MMHTFRKYDLIKCTVCTQFVFRNLYLGIDKTHCYLKKKCGQLILGRSFQLLCSWVNLTCSVGKESVPVSSWKQGTVDTLIFIANYLL